MNRLKHYPIVLDDQEGSGRPTQTVPLANSAVAHLGGFFDPYTGTGGAQTFTANQRVRGVVADILVYTGNGYASLMDAVGRNATLRGTYTAGTATNNARYTAASNNVTSAFPDLVVYNEINIGDRVIAYLGNAGSPVARGTTAGSAVLNNFLEPLPSFPHMLDEAGVSATATGLCFRIVGLPANRHTVEVKLINADGAVS